ncbi:hypothetical protein J7K18_01315 [bacterium]|nr:hypothetical protein [bacterium]
MEKEIFEELKRFDISLIRDSLQFLADGFASSLPEKVEETLSLAERIIGFKSFQQFASSDPENATYEVLSSLVDTISGWSKLTSFIPDIIVVRRYLAEVKIPEDEEALFFDRITLQNQLELESIINVPSIAPSVISGFAKFLENYSARYADFHKRYHEECQALLEKLESKGREKLSALEYLMKIKGFEEADELEYLKSSYQHLKSVLSPCTEDVKRHIRYFPYCLSCRVHLGDKPPSYWVRRFLRRLDSKLRSILARLSRGTAKRILQNREESSIQRFVDAVTVSDLSSLPTILSDELIDLVNDILESEIAYGCVLRLSEIVERFPEVTQENKEEFINYIRERIEKLLAENKSVRLTED